MSPHDKEELLLLHYRLDMCRRQYANDVCNRGTAGTFLEFEGNEIDENRKLSLIYLCALLYERFFLFFFLLLQSKFLSLQPPENMCRMVENEGSSRGFHSQSSFVVYIHVLFEILKRESCSFGQICSGVLLFLIFDEDILCAFVILRI